MLQSYTNPQGYWIVYALPSGNYNVTASSQGFQSATASVNYDANNPTAYRQVLNVGAAATSIEVVAQAVTLNTESSAVSDSREKKHKNAPAKPAAPPPPPASTNVFNLQQRVAGVLPVAVDVPRAGVSYRFLRPLVLNEETSLSFTYKSK
jgi:hypothetical protein